MGLFSRNKKKNAAAAPEAAPAPAATPAAEASAAPAAAAQGGDMFSGMNSAPSQGGDMFGGMQSAPSQGGDMFAGMNNNAPAAAPAAAPAPAATPAPAAAPAQDPLMGARQKLMQISNQFRREISVLNEGERKVRDMVSETEAAISTLEGQLVQCETANADAVANDDFARAEELSNQADAIRAQIEGKNSEIMQCMQRNGQAMQLRVNRVQTDLVSIDAMIASFAAAYNHVNTQFIAYAKQLDDQAASHDARLAGMMNTIKEKENQLAAKREAIAAEKEVVEEQVREDSKELFQEKEEAVALKQTLDQEIAELKEKLHQKNQELLACTKHIAETDQKIQQVRVRFMPQFQPIEEKFKALGGDVKAIETMRQQYGTAESRVAMVKQSAEEDKKQKKEIVDTRKDELDSISEVAEALRAYNQAINSSFQDVLQKKAAMYAQKKQLAADSVHSQGIINRIQMLEKTIADNTAIVQDASSKLPSLEKQKAEAIASKNYKAAGQITNQMKQLQAAKDTADMALSQATEELNGIRADSSKELQELESKKAIFENTRRVYLEAHYAMLRSNAIVTRKAVRKIQAITYGDDTFRFSCEAIVTSLFELANSELMEIAAALNLPPLGEHDGEEVEESSNVMDAIEEMSSPMANPEEETGAETRAETRAETAGDDMFAMSDAPANGPLTAERASHLATVAEAQMEQKNNDLDAAMEAEKEEECEKLGEEIEQLETYAGELKKFAAGEVSEEPVAPACFDEFFAAKSNGDDLFLGM